MEYLPYRPQLCETSLTNYSLSPRKPSPVHAARLEARHEPSLAAPPIFNFQFSIPNFQFWRLLGAEPT
jgi:hypothetical protein